jgi:hypothetical protein
MDYIIEFVEEARNGKDCKPANPLRKIRYTPRTEYSPTKNKFVILAQNWPFQIVITNDQYKTLADAIAIASLATDKHMLEVKVINFQGVMPLGSLNKQDLKERLPEVYSLLRVPEFL